MIAKHDGLYYNFVKGRHGPYELITQNKKKALANFQNDNGIYFKNIEILDPQLTEVFDLEIWIQYDTGLPNVNTEWQIDLSRESFKNGKIQLMFTEGILPGWRVEEKNVCFTTLNLTDISAARVVYRYIKRHGQLLMSVVTKVFTKLEF